MLNEFLTPVSDELREYVSGLDEFAIGKNIHFNNEFPESSIVIFGLNTHGSEGDFDSFRKEFYSLMMGDWNLTMTDLGDLHIGATKEDTAYAFVEIQKELIQKKCIALILGDDLEYVYWQLRSFDDFKKAVNISCIDKNFRLGNSLEDLSQNNFLSRIITDEPRILFDYTHIGYQTYFINRSELELMEAMNFELKRLGKVTEDISECEPELRNSDMTALNLDALQSTDFRSSLEQSPNGLNSREVCALSRYSGINNKTRSFGVYNYRAKNIPVDDILLAEMFWYFIEGKNHAPDGFNDEDKELYETYFVQIPEQDLIFYRDTQSDQWWIEVSGMEEFSSDGKHVIPCSGADYEDSLKGKIPERWWKAYKKLY